MYIKISNIQHPVGFESTTSWSLSASGPGQDKSGRHSSILKRELDISWSWQIRRSRSQDHLKLAVFPSEIDWNSRNTLLFLTLVIKNSPRPDICQDSWPIGRSRPWPATNIAFRWLQGPSSLARGRHRRSAKADPGSHEGNAASQAHGQGLFVDLCGFQKFPEKRTLLVFH